MMSFEQEINQIKTSLLKNFIDPIPNDSLKNFIVKGKFVRSALAILYLKASNCHISEGIYKILEAGELIHSASLLHDDVIDNAKIRRNETVIAKQFDSKISILAGDLLISKSIKKLLELNNPDILELFRCCTEKMAGSEIEQYFLRSKKTTFESYIEICKGKTANLFATILESCAIIANLPIEKAKSFGLLFGTFFQIKNDLNPESANVDKNNKIYTAIDIIGIEKTINLLDNYKEEMSKIIDTFPKDVYKRELKDLIESI